MSLTRIQRGFIANGAVTVPDNLYTTGTASASTFLRGDGAWAIVPLYDQDLNTTSSVTFSNLTVTNTSTINTANIGTLKFTGGISTFIYAVTLPYPAPPIQTMYFNSPGGFVFNGDGINTQKIYSSTVTTNGHFFLNSIVNTTASNILYYNTSTGEITYSSLPTFVNTSTNLAGGTAGQLVYQSAPGLTSFYGPGTAGQILISGGTGGPFYSNTTSLAVGYATTSGYAVSFNTATLVATAVNIVNTSTTQVGYATTAGFAVTFNTATLVAQAVNIVNTSTTQVGYATTAGFAVTFNTATLVAQAVNIVNTSTTQVGFAATAGQLLPANTGSQYVGYAGRADSINTLSSIQVQSLIVTTGTTINQALSIGGYPLDGNGRALIDVLNTESAALIVTNYDPNLLPRIHMRGWGQNIPAGLSTTAQGVALFMDGARGTPASPTANLANDTLGQISIGGFDGNNYLTTSTNGPLFTMFAAAAENFAYNGTTTTNAGVTFNMRLQPPRVWYTATSRPSVLNMTWTTSTTAPPSFNLGLGQGNDGTLAYLTSSDNPSAPYQGFGRNVITTVNSQLTFYNVTVSDLSPDNSSLTASGANTFNFSTSRRNGLSGRRNPLLAGDQMTQLDWFGNGVPNGTQSGSLTAQIGVKALDNFTSTQYGSQMNLSTVNSGTTTLSARLLLDSNNNVYNSANHTFQGTTNLTTMTFVNATETVYAWSTATGTISPNISSGTVQTMTLAGGITLNSITNAVTGSSITLIINQPASGGPYLLTSTMKWAGGNKTLSTAASAIDMVTIFYDGTTYYGSLIKGFA